MASGVLYTFAMHGTFENRSKMNVAKVAKLSIISSINISAYFMENCFGGV